MQADEFDALVDSFDPPHEKERPVVISGKHTYTSQLKIVLKQLAGPVVNTAKPPAGASVAVRSQTRRPIGR